MIIELKEELGDKYKHLNIKDMDMLYYNLTKEKDAFSYETLWNIYQWTYFILVQKGVQKLLNQPTIESKPIENKTFAFETVEGKKRHYWSWSKLSDELVSDKIWGKKVKVSEEFKKELI